MTNQMADTAKPGGILSQTDFFQGLTPGQIDRVAAVSEMQHFEGGHHVYRIGEPAKAVYVLVDGTVRMAIGFGGRNANAGDIVRRGDVFGWAALTPGCNQRIAMASCLSRCDILAVDGVSLLNLMEQDHTLGYRLMTQLTRLITGTLTAFAGG
jgi:CRP-like cAMP-binding protein